MRSDIPHDRLRHFEMNVKGFESLILKVTIGDTDTIFVAFYKHPFLSDNLFKQHFCNFADMSLRSYEDIVSLAMQMVVLFVAL